MRLLLTGFEPFGGETVNPSGEVVRAIAADPPRDVDVTPLVLPVRGRISFEALLPVLDSREHDAWLGLGEAGGRPHLSVERVGINVLVDRSVSGRPGEEQPLVEDGPAAYFSRLPVAGLAHYIAGAGTPAAVSNTAGMCICNEVTYVVQHHLASTARDLPSGFIHLPYLPEQAATKPPGTPSLDLASQLAGVRAAVEFVRDLVRERGTRGG